MFLFALDTNNDGIAQQVRAIPTEQRWKMFREYDVVRLKHGVPAEDPQAWAGVPSTALQAGASGTIVAVYENDQADHTYEVEFAAADGSTLGLLTLTDSDIESAD